MHTVTAGSKAGPVTALDVGVGRFWRDTGRSLFILAALYCVLYIPILTATKTGLVRPLVLVGLFGTLLSAMRARVLDIRVPMSAVGVATGLFAALTFAQLLAFLGGADLFLRSLIVGIFSGILPLAYLVVWAIPRRKSALQFLARAVAGLGALQSVLIVADWLSPSVRGVFAAIFMQPEGLNEGIRAAGLTSMTGDGLSVSQAICAVFAMYLAVTSERRWAIAGWALSLGMMLATMMFVGRTGYVLVGFFAVFMAVFDPRRKRVLMGFAVVVIALAGGVWAITASIQDERLAGLFSKVVSHAFEAIIGVGQGEGLRTASTDDLSSMILLPDSLRGWLIGYGFYSNPANPDVNYMGTDIGYLRVLLYVGLVGSLAIYIWYFWVGVSAYRSYPRRQDRLLCAGLMSCFFISQIKFSFLLLLAPLSFTLLLFFAAVRDRTRCA